MPRIAPQPAAPPVSTTNDSADARRPYFRQTSLTIDDPNIAGEAKPLQKPANAAWCSPRTSADMLSKWLKNVGGGMLSDRRQCGRGVQPRPAGQDPLQ
jgi:hypothetical protein